MAETTAVDTPRAPGADERAPGSIKCVVWDLDNTLWDGVLLEDDEVTVRPEVVEVIRRLDERGILHSVASKNEPGPARAKLEELGLAEYFLYPQIHWNPKSSSVEAIAREINIGIDALAFVDDQPFEREEVAFSHPQVLCFDAAEPAALLEHPALVPRFVTEESRRRRHMYRADAERRRVEEEFEGPKEEFLATLGLRFTIGPCRESDLQRAEELTVRTNQLNATGVTYSHEELDALRRCDDHELLVCSLEDKHGSYGTIGLALIGKEEAGDGGDGGDGDADGADRRPVWTLELLLMSCRVLSKGVGSVLLQHVMARARDAGAVLRAQFVTTDRNRLMLVTYRFAGFRTVETRDDGVSILENDLSTLQPVPDYVELVVRDAERGPGGGAL